MRSEAKPVSRTLRLKLFLMGSKILIQFEFSTQVLSRLITKSEMRVRKEITWMEAQVDDSPARSRASEGFTWPGQRRMFVCITCRDGMPKGWSSSSCGEILSRFWKFMPPLILIEKHVKHTKTFNVAEIATTTWIFLRRSFPQKSINFLFRPTFYDSHAPNSFLAFLPLFVVSLLWSYSRYHAPHTNTLNVIASPDHYAMLRPVNC